ncbi:MAG: NusG domain II-containing protein [Spirochaetales bacterium]|nr:NusG domain II-containing protein [Spirochaetales bacterium]
MKAKPLDILIIVAASCGIVWYAVSVYRTPSGPGNVVIRTFDREYIYGLQNNEVVDIEGPMGTTRVLIENGAVRVLSSPCPMKICMKKGPISQAGEWIACLPNAILIRITGVNHERPEIDSVSY